MQTIAILGLGLMGGSLGRALKRGPAGIKVTAYARRAETRNLAMSLDACDEVFDDPSDAVRDADLVVVCVPVQTIPALVESCRAALKPGVIITDVGSTKGTIGARVTSLLAGRKATYVGSHPVAGAELEGLESSRPELYDGAAVIVTADEATPSEAVESVKQMWEALGSVVYLMPALSHDRLMARTSHLPHVLSAVLAGVVGREDAEMDVGAFCGTGFIDTTRIADGSPAVWRDIVETNTEAILLELERTASELEGFRRLLADGDFDGVEKYFAQVRDRRRRLLEGNAVAGTEDQP